MQKTIPFLLLFMALLSTHHCRAQILTPVNAGLINMGGDVAWFDYDNDNDLDIIQIGGTNDTPPYDKMAIVYRNNGNGTFTNINAGLYPVIGAVAVADFDNDGNIDIIETGGTSANALAGATTKVYKNNGNGTFTDMNVGIIGLVSGASLKCGDYDNDGDVDVLMCGRIENASFITKIYRNDGGWTFVDIGVGLPGVWGDVNCADIDKDGDLDLIVAGQLQNGSRISNIYRNDGGTFTNINAGLPALDFCTAEWGDYDSDGYPDLALVGRLTTYTSGSYIFHNNGNGSFTNINAGIVAVVVASLAWGDVDNDGDLDLALCGGDLFSGGYTKIYRNDGNNLFTSSLDLTPAYYGALSWGDYDNDGRLDLLVSGYWAYGSPTNTTKLYHNNTAGANTTPTAPTNLSAVLSGNTVTLSWSKSTDNQTSQNGLTYNIRVGTTPSGTQVASPMAFVSNGLRKVAKFGKSSTNNTWQITGINPGTYYWSVQAIDNSLAGSPFAQEGTFTLNQSPIALCTNVTVPAGASCTANAFIDNGSYDPDGDPITLSQSPAGPYPLGTTSVTLTVADNKGGSSTCTATVTVIDNTPPAITCPAPISQVVDPTVCGAVVSFTPTATDNCTGTTVTCIPASGSVFPIGTSSVTCTATDASGNVSSPCSFNVTVFERKYRSVASGNWSSPAVWQTSTDQGVSWTAATQVPGDNCDDIVFVRNGHTVTINRDFAIKKLTVGEGMSGDVRFDATGTPRNVVIKGDLYLDIGSSFKTATTGTQTAHSLTLGDDLVANGTINLIASSNSGWCGITFNNTSPLQVIAGTGSCTFGPVTLDKALVTDKVEAVRSVSIQNFPITFLKGTWEQSIGTMTSSAYQNIPTTGRLVISGTASYQKSNNTMDVSGVLIVNTTSSFSIGTSSATKWLNINSGGSATLTSGNVFIGGFMKVNSGSLTINGAAITLDPQIGSTALAATNNVFDIRGSSTVTFSSGSVTIADPIKLTGTGREIFINTTGAANFTGGVINLGDGIGTSNGADGFEIFTNKQLQNLTLQGNGSGRDAKLMSNMTIGGALNCASSSLNTNGFTATLTAIATLTEATGKTVVGKVVTDRVIASTSYTETFGGIGVEINVGATPLGLTTVTRTTGTAVGSGLSIKRTFNLVPTTNTGLNAGMIFHYDDTELNGNSEASLNLFESTNAGTNWLNRGATSRDGSVNTVTLNGINSFDHWTLSSGTLPKRNDEFASASRTNEFTLDPNYPNPFSSMTEISYAIPDERFVAMTIVNAMGAEVARLVDEAKNAGAYTVRFNAAALPSGVYFCRLRAGDATKVIRLSVMK